VDINRRKFLKIILIGSGTFLVGKILEPLFSKSLFSDEPLAKTNSLTKINGGDSHAFRVVEDKKSLSIYDNSGEEIFQIDKGA